ncbi:SprB repeat-containing protein, partial [Flavobacterium sp. SaA2.13]|uniref:SprB repeat-containing protein n=1 Tax=Flavobacterium sp. SaA2.13 TaxID=2691898 RepID=UPI00178C7DBE
TVTGGTAPYTYVWNTTATTQDLTGLPAGTYEVTVTDANGCTATASVTVTQPTVLSASGTATNVSCNAGSNGAVDLTVTGGTAPYTYVWNNAATTQDLTGLTASTYDVTVTDANGCT